MIQSYPQLGQPGSLTSTWKRTSANGLLREDNKNSNGCNQLDDLSKGRSEFSEDERLKNVTSVDGPQFSTFIRVRFYITQ